MQLPYADNAVVERKKIVEYLLCSTHPDGCSKAAFFARLGFDGRNWLIFAETLKLHGQRHSVNNVVESEFGVRYTVDGEIEAPGGRTARIRTVWIVEKGSMCPRLITAHPL